MADSLGQRPRVVLCSSSGGVLLDLLALRPWWEHHEHSWVAVRAPDTEQLLSGESVRWVDESSFSNPYELLRSTLSARRHLRAIEPELIISAGTGVAAPVFLAARTLGMRCWWLETFNLVGSPGITARICSVLAERTIVQRPSLLSLRRRSVLVGELY